MKIRSWLTRKGLLILAAILFFGIFLWIGKETFRDYGTHIDEGDQVQIGLKNISFLRTRDPAELADFKDWDHGALFETFLTLGTAFLHSHLMVSLFPYEIRHLLSYLSFWASGIVFFAFIWYRYKNGWMGLLGAAFLFLSPVIYGNAFFNSKDIPLLSFTILAMFSQTLFLEKPNLARGAFHALACAMAVNIRIPAIIIPAITVGIWTLEWLVPNRREFHPRAGRSLVQLGTFLVLLLGFSYLFFPAIWLDPVRRFAQAYVQLSHRGWMCCNLFFGQMITADTIPWYYVPAWIGISTPLWIVILFLAGTVKSISDLLRRPLLTLTAEKRTHLVNLATLALPVLMVVVLQSVIYNGWRHMYFVYVPFLLIALEGLWAGIQFLKSQRRLNPRLAVSALGLVTLLSLGPVSVKMIQNHPYEFIYFNELLGDDMQAIKQKFELDYWGLSIVDGLRWIAANDPREQIFVALKIKKANMYKELVNEADRERLILISDSLDTDYFMSDYLLHPQDYDYPNKVYAVKVGNADILSIFKTK